MLTYMKQLFTLAKMVHLSPLTDERMMRNEEKREGKIRPSDSISGRPLLHFGAALSTVFTIDLQGVFFLLTFLLISFHLLVCERGELYHLNEHKNLLLTRETY